MSRWCRFSRRFVAWAVDSFFPHESVAEADLLSKSAGGWFRFFSLNISPTQPETQTPKKEIIAEFPVYNDLSDIAAVWIGLQPYEQNL